MVLHSKYRTHDDQKKPDLHVGPSVDVPLTTSMHINPLSQTSAQHLTVIPS